MIMIQVRSEADLAKLIDLVKGSNKVSQTLRDSSARWENLYFGDEEEVTAVRVVSEPAPMRRELIESLR